MSAVCYGLASLTRRPDSPATTPPTSNPGLCSQSTHLTRSIEHYRPINPFCRSRLPPLQRRVTRSSMYNFIINILGPFFPALLAACRKSCSKTKKPERAATPTAAAPILEQAMGMVRRMPLNPPVMETLPFLQTKIFHGVNGGIGILTNDFDSIGAWVGLKLNDSRLTPW